ncbi:hypothetical protein BGX28_007850 [Mortierella sp. GBA30]|nr:hypothetical protein BGX28_007850 [Mortierella sp. GBA30]
MSSTSPIMDSAIQIGAQIIAEDQGAKSRGTLVESKASESHINQQRAPGQQSVTPQQQQQPSIFLKKKPTVASIGSRPLLKPFNNKFVDYNNPGKHDSLEPVPLKAARGTAISIPGSVADAQSASSSSSSLASNTTPFTFDNHTQESRAENIKDGTGTNNSNNNSSDAFTILRIKRKRNEEPLDTLVVQDKLDKLAGKKQKKIEDEAQREIQNALAGDISLPKPPPAVFRLATTVNKDSFKDPTQSMQLRDRITSLAETPRPRSRLSERQQPEFEERMQGRRGELAHQKQQDARTARYRVINQNRSGLSAAEKKPPQVKSSVEAEAEAALDMFKVYDAVKEDEPKTKKQIAAEAEESDIMCNFLPMVREYLTISDKVPDPKISLKDGGRSSAASSVRGDQSDYDSEDEYVYDIYYRDVNADHQQESKHRAIGSLDDENNFMNEDDSSEDDYEDSDSNAEDYYQNDYPEDAQSDDEYAYELSDTDDDDYMY